MGYAKQYPVANEDSSSDPTSKGRWLNLVPVGCTGEVITDCAKPNNDPKALLRQSNPHYFGVESHVFQPLGAQAVSFDTWQRTLQALVNAKEVDSEIWRLAMTMFSMYPSCTSLPGLDKKPLRTRDDDSASPANRFLFGVKRGPLCGMDLAANSL